MTTARQGLVLGPDLAGTLMTATEFGAEADREAGYRYELIDEILHEETRDRGRLR